MDYTYALQAVADHTGWNMDDVIMTAEYRNGYEFTDREGREWTVTQRYGEFVIDEDLV